MRYILKLRTDDTKLIHEVASGPIDDYRSFFIKLSASRSFLFVSFWTRIETTLSKVENNKDSRRIWPRNGKDDVAFDKRTVGNDTTYCFI